MNADCTNIKGSFYCTCIKGYAGDGVTCSGKPFILACLVVRNQILLYTLLKRLCCAPDINHTNKSLTRVPVNALFNKLNMGQECTYVSHHITSSCRITLHPSSTWQSIHYTNGLTLEALVTHHGWTQLRSLCQG